MAVCLAFQGSHLDQVQAASVRQAGLGVDVDFYTGPIDRGVWLNMEKAGIEFVIAQAWGGRSMNEFAASQLLQARSIGRMKEAAYILLNFDDKVCPTYANPVRDRNGKCLGDAVLQDQPGARWQVRQGLAALRSELAYAAFIALDVEWFLNADPPADPEAQARRRLRILDGIDEVRKSNKKAVIYTRNGQRHWRDITGCETNSSLTDCIALSEVINDPSAPIPLWDVQDGVPDLESFQPYGGWSTRSGRQYKLDRNLFGLLPQRTVDLNVFDLSLFSSP